MIADDQVQSYLGKTLYIQETEDLKNLSRIRRAQVE